MKKLLILILLINVLPVCAQSKIVVTITDSVTKAPLPFVTIYIKNAGVGANTNLEGIAYLHVKNNQFLLDTLICSYVGYQKEIIPIELNKNISLQLSLKPSSTMLASVDVVYEKPLSVKKILRNALKNTKENYSSTGVNLEGLYRETIQENENYIILNEAIVDIHYTACPQNSIDLKTYKKWQYDDSYAFGYKSTWFDGFPIQFNTRDDKVRLIATRTSETASPNKLDVPINGGPLSLTAKDYVKYRYDFLNPDTFDNYIYKKQKSETIKNRDCYVIHFHPKASNKSVVFNHIRKNQNGIYVGNLYIDKKSFAIVKIEYQLIQDFDYGFYQYRIPLDYTVTVDYNLAPSNKWFLEKIVLKQVRKIDDRNTNTALLITASQELFITKIDSVEPHNISEENEWKHTKFTQLRTYENPYDEEVWKNYQFYPALPTKIKGDLEKNKSLTEQFKGRFKPKENLPVPIVKKERFVFNYPTEALEDDYQWFAFKNRSNEFYEYINKENVYAENYILPYRTYQRSFFDAVNNFYKIDTVEQTYARKKGDYSWDVDSLENLALVEHLDSVNRRTIFDYSSFKTSRKNCFLSKNPKMSDNHLAFVYTSNGGLNNQLVFFKKGNPIMLDSISDVYSFEWFNDSLLLYAKENDVKRSDKLFCRNINSQVDSLLLHEADLTFDIDLEQTKSYLVCTVQSKNENEIYLASKKDEFPNFQEFLKREHAVYSIIKEFDEYIYVLTNKNALNNKVVRHNNGEFKEIVPHHAKVHIQDFTITNNYIVLKTYENSFVKLKCKKFTDKKWMIIDFKNEIFDVDFSPIKEDQLSIVFSTPREPYTGCVYDIARNELVKGRSQEMNYSSNQDRKYVQMNRIWTKAEDGVKIPMTIIKSSNPKRNHKGLILKAYGMYGAFYGGYGFSSEDFILLKEGYTIVYAHVRGGGEMGNQWHIDGQLLNKENTFNDYIRCAEFLIKKEYTDAEHLVGYGNSAGGLLMGVVINRRPDLFNTVILDHPYLDALTTMMMDTIPLTTDHYKEVGNPNDPEVYEYMKNYSPYQNIKKQAYPNLLFIASSNDYQTPTWQIAKYVAKVREYNTGATEIIFKTDIGSGHIGNTNGSQWIKDLAYKYTFVYSNLFNE